MEEEKEVVKEEQSSEPQKESEVGVKEECSQKKDKL